MVISGKNSTFAENKSYRNMAKRKIGFYYLFLKQDDVEMPIEANLLNVLAFLGLKSRVERKQDISNDRFAFSYCI